MLRGTDGLELVIVFMVLQRRRHSCDLMIENRPLASFLVITVMISFYSRYFCKVSFLSDIWKISFDINGYHAFLANADFIFAVCNNKAGWTGAKL